MQSDTAAGVAPAAATASRSLETLSSLSINDVAATTTPSEPQPQQQPLDEAPFVTFASKKQRKKKVAASVSAGDAGASNNNNNSSTSGTSSIGVSKSYQTAVAASSSAKRKVATATTTAAPTASATKSKAKAKGFGKERPGSAPPLTSASATAVAAARAFVPTHMPAWKPDVARVNDPTIPIAERLGHEMVSYCAYTSARVASLQKSIDAAIAHIAACVQAIWPEATVACFGSFASGLWLPSSDVDVVVMGLTNDHDPDVRTRFVVGTRELQQIAARLRKQRWVQRIDVVGSAKVPVAKLVLADSSADTLLRVDISIENLHTRRGMDASDLVREYIVAVPALHTLIIVVKQLLREKGLNNAFTGGLSSYTVALLAVYLFERQTLLQQQAENDDSDDEDGGGPSHRAAPPSDAAALGQLLLDFLEFYGMTFSYATTGISLKREAFGEYYLAPHLLRSNGVALVPQLVVDDPVYLDGQHNAAAGAFAIARVIAAFENAFFAVVFHRPSKFTPTPLCQLLHWSGHAAASTSAK